MKRLIIILFLMLCTAGIKAQVNNNINLNSMIATEYMFAKSASEIGTRDAFLKFIADDGILFRPKPVNGRKFLMDSQKRPGLLSWYPVYAKVSSDGNMGFTTGPADFRKDKDSAAVWFGNFSTVWQRQSDGEWKFVIDYGNSCAQPEVPFLGVEYRTGWPSMSSGHIITESLNPDELISIDQGFQIDAEKNGIESAYQKYIDDESRILPEGSNPIIGTEQIIKYLSGKSGIISFKPVGGRISSSNDIGFTYGEMDMNDPKINFAGRYNYLRIFKKEGTDWHIAVEVFNKKDD